MQGSHVEMRDKFPAKKKDPSKSKAHKADRAWRNKRQNRHESE